jgi:hypothetical protein
MHPYVVLPGGWAGGWQSPQVAKLLKSAGHTVFSVTFTYLSGSVNPSDPETILKTHHPGWRCPRS